MFIYIYRCNINPSMSPVDPPTNATIDPSMSSSSMNGGGGGNGNDNGGVNRRKRYRYMKIPGVRDHLIGVYRYITNVHSYI